MELLGSGAEAQVFLDGNTVLKHRTEKQYRLPEIDQELRKSRTRREAKLLDTLKIIGFPGPKLISMSDKEMKIEMSLVDGEKLRDILEKNPAGFGREIGQLIGALHKNNITHGDLTTSNMILCNKTKKIHFIDFGLGVFSTKAEDKAVDLYLLKRALESKHHTVFEETFNQALEGYQEEYPDAGLVLNRYAKVVLRGRNKH